MENENVSDLEEDLLIFMLQNYTQQTYQNLIYIITNLNSEDKIEFNNFSEEVVLNEDFEGDEQTKADLLTKTVRRLGIHKIKQAGLFIDNDEIETLPLDFIRELIFSIVSITDIGTGDSIYITSIITDRYEEDSDDDISVVYNVLNYINPRIGYISFYQYVVDISPKLIPAIQQLISQIIDSDNEIAVDEIVENTADVMIELIDIMNKFNYSSQVVIELIDEVSLKLYLNNSGRIINETKRKIILIFQQMIDQDNMTNIIPDLIDLMVIVCLTEGSDRIIAELIDLSESAKDKQTMKILYNYANEIYSNLKDNDFFITLLKINNTKDK